LLGSNLETDKGAEKGKEESKLVDTDDPWDLFLSGTDIQGSCQSVDGSPHLNKCLLAYVLDGKNRMLAVKGPDGRIEARAIFRLLYDTENDKPVLFMERIYSNRAGQFDEALLNMAKKRAEAMGLKLLRSQGKERYLGKVEGLGSSLPYEYVDAAGGVHSDGKFKINEAYVLSE